MEQAVSSLRNEQDPKINRTASPQVSVKGLRAEDNLKRSAHFNTDVFIANNSLASVS